MFATTGNVQADAVLSTLDATIAPFREAPPAEQGAAGWVSAGLGGALGVINAPSMFIDAAASVGVSAVLDALGLSGLFPPMPVAVIGLSMHLGTPHTHIHPPSTVPPAPPIPLPSMGVAFLAGSASVLVGGIPALRAGDIGIGFTCGSGAPPFEIMTGASGVYFAGARVARYGMDITFHCNPAEPMGGFAMGMGVAGVVAGAAGAAAQASAGNATAAAVQAAQAALDAAALAVSALRGKDPAGPPGIGMLLGPPMGNVVAGGPPIPNVGAFAQGKLYSALGRALRSMRGRLRRRTPPADANGRTCEGGEPVHVVTGANYNTHLDFASLLGGFEWTRFTSSDICAERGVLGFGWRHVFETHLEIRLHRVTFVSYEGEQIEFPRLRNDDDIAMHGYRLQRLSPTRFRVTQHRIGKCEFERVSAGATRARLTKISRDGLTIELRYDAHQRLQDLIEYDESANGRVAQYSLGYDRAGQLESVWGAHRGQAAQRLVAYHYDAWGRLLRAEDATGAAESFAYDRKHRIVRAFDRAGYGFTWEYDHEGRCVLSRGDDGLWYAAFEYLPGNQTTKMTIHDGTVYTFVYDEDGVITKVVGPEGSVKQRLRARDGRVVAEVESGGQRIDFLYDPSGGHCARRDRFGNTFPPSLDVPGVPNTLARNLPRDAHGYLLGELAPAGQPTPEIIDRRRDLRGNVVYERDSLGAERRWAFDAEGNQTAYVDGDGRNYQREIVSWGLVGARIDPNGHTTRYEFNPHQKITKITDPGGTESRYVYDSHDRLVEVHRHGRLRERYVWDTGHRLVETQDRLGQPLLKIKPHANSLPGKLERADGGVVEYDYDEHGKVIRADTSDHQLRRQFDGSRQLELEDCDGLTVRHRYDRHGRSSTTIAERFVCTWERHGDLVTMTDPCRRVRMFRHAPDGTVQFEHGNGTREVQQYDQRGRLLQRKVWPQAGTPNAPQPWHVRYQYTAEGDLVAAHDSARGARSYQIDAAHRLASVNLPDGSTQRFVHDAAGNLLETPEVGRMHLDSGNRLQHADGELFGYDDRDHIATRSSPDGVVTRYHYDSEDQLVRVDDAEPEPWTATYDGLGRRVTFGRGDRRTRLWWDEDRIAASQGPDGELRIYLYADARALVPIGFVDYDSIDAPRESGRSYSVLCDQVGLPQYIEDADGNVVWWAESSTPYGELRVRSGNSVEYHLRFPGHFHDPDVRLHYNRFRDYDPRLGRYLQSDPLGCAGGVNVYAYPANPLVAVDVLGLSGHPPRDTAPPPEEGGETRPRTEGTEAGDAGEPTAFPGLRRGGDADVHAARVGEVMADLRTEAGRRRIAGESYDAETQRQVDRQRGRLRDPARQDAREAEIRERRAAGRAAAIDRTEAGLRGVDEGSATVITHDDGHVSVGVSSGNRRQADTIVGELNRRHPGPDGGNTYGTTTRPVDTTGFTDAGPPNPTRGNCSEPAAGQAAREHVAAGGGEPNGFQTIWAGDPATNPYSQDGATVPGTPHQTMDPCLTCQANQGNYL